MEGYTVYTAIYTIHVLFTDGIIEKLVKQHGKVPRFSFIVCVTVYVTCF